MHSPTHMHPSIHKPFISHNRAYSRLGYACYQLGEYQEAVEAYTVRYALLHAFRIAWRGPRRLCAAFSIMSCRVDAWDSFRRERLPACLPACLANECGLPRSIIHARTQPPTEKTNEHTKQRALELDPSVAASKEFLDKAQAKLKKQREV